MTTEMESGVIGSAPAEKAYFRIYRWGERKNRIVPGLVEIFYVTSGFKSSEAIVDHQGTHTRSSRWDEQGHLINQHGWDSVVGKKVFKTEPPWLFGHKDQVEPCAPWLKK